MHKSINAHKSVRARKAAVFIYKKNDQAKIDQAREGSQNI